MMGQVRTTTWITVVWGTYSVDDILPLQRAVVRLLLLLHQGHVDTVALRLDHLVCAFAKFLTSGLLQLSLDVSTSKARE